jgi:hypothetical protein
MSIRGGGRSGKRMDWESRLTSLRVCDKRVRHLVPARGHSVNRGRELPVARLGFDQEASLSASYNCLPTLFCIGFH